MTGAKTLLAAAPVAGSASVGDQIMALPEAKGRKQLAQALAEQPGMTVAQAKTLLAAAPAASQPSQEALLIALWHSMLPVRFPEAELPGTEKKIC